MGYWDLDVDEQEKADADMLKLRIDSYVDKKCDKGIAKELITKEESEKMLKALKKAIRKHKEVDYWTDQKGKKSFEIAIELLEDAPELEILMKIEKA